MKKLLNDFIKNEDGVTAIEYAVIGVAMAAVLMASFTGKDGIKEKLITVFNQIKSTLDSAAA